MNVQSNNNISLISKNKLRKRGEQNDINMDITEMADMKLMMNTKKEIIQRK